MRLALARARPARSMIAIAPRVGRSFAFPSHFACAPPFRACSTKNEGTVQTQPSDGINVDADGQIPGTRLGGEKMAIVFTCTKCDTRSARQFSKVFIIAFHLVLESHANLYCHLCSNRTKKGLYWCAAQVASLFTSSRTISAGLMTKKLILKPSCKKRAKVLELLIT